LTLSDYYSVSSPTTGSSSLRDDVINRIQLAQEQGERVSDMVQPRVSFLFYLIMTRILIHIQKASEGTDSHSETLKQLEDDVRTLEEQYAQIKRKVNLESNVLRNCY
jgi:cell division protein FtsB